MAKKDKPTVLVTRATLTAMIEHADRAKQKQIVGRALLAIYNRQTAAEKQALETKESNGIGFAGCDAKSGSRAAEGFKKFGTLLDWQLDAWMQRGEHGHMRITKYHGQLNAIALERQREKSLRQTLVDAQQAQIPGTELK